MRILICVPNWIGDAVMATPTLAALRDHYPEAHLAWLVRPYVAPVLEPAPEADEVLHWGGSSGLRGWPLVRRLRSERYDLGVLLTNSFRSAWLFFAGGVRERVGYARDGRGLLLSRRLRAPRQAGHYLPTPAITYYFELARLLGAADRPLEMTLHTSPADEAAADGVYRSLELEPASTLILAPGAAFGMAKCWPPDRFAEVARRARDEKGLRSLVLCSPDELPVARAIVEGSGGAAAIPPAPRPGLSVVKALVRRARAMVTNDSGLRHVAAAFDVPVVAIFGPTHVQWTETWFARETKLQARVPCGPCQQPRCPEGHLRCMMEIAPEQVFDAFGGLLAEFPYREPDEATIIRPGDAGDGFQGS